MIFSWFLKSLEYSLASPLRPLEAAYDGTEADIAIDDLAGQCGSLSEAAKHVDLLLRFLVLPYRDSRVELSSGSTVR